MWETDPKRHATKLDYQNHAESKNFKVKWVKGVAALVPTAKIIITSLRDFAETRNLKIVSKMTSTCLAMEFSEKSYFNKNF